ncbi:MAG: RluA family pseudouridine synthase [Candidatus Omnitrophota bacterium]|nr:RluA family pseudouridine synthase [Candidatus Omnitrophota bacterium]
MNIPIVYEDDWLLVLDKPSGLLTIPTPKKESRTLTSILNDDLKEKGMPYRLHPCHRLDRETSGLIIYAKGKSIQQKMMELFRQKKVKKSYVALVNGNLAQKEGAIKIAIEGQAAQTRYKVIEKKEGFDIVEVSPLTGRRNQIRVHFKHLGHPILGDTKFAFRRDFKIKAKRLMLHARDLEFPHPVTGKPIHLRAELPPDMSVVGEGGVIF